MAESGYTPCACRDCMDIAVSDDMAHPDLCTECEEAGCNEYPGEERAAALPYPAGGYECQRDDAYGAGDEGDDDTDEDEGEE